MSYETSQNAATGEPVELYRIVGLGQTYLFTSASENITYNSETYLATRPIRSSVRSINQKDLLKNGIEINMPSNHPMVLAFLQQIPGDPVQVTIFRGYQPDFITYWKGSISSVEASDPVASIRCEPITKSLNRKTLRLRILANCNHVLYDSQCGLVRDNFRANGIVDAVPTSFTLQSSTFALQADQYYRGGALHIFGTPQGTFKTLILDHVGNTVKVQANLSQVSAGLNLSIWPGCNHDIPDCTGKFANLPNYGGFPAIPTKNPFSGDAIV